MMENESKGIGGLKTIVIGFIDSQLPSYRQENGSLKPGVNNAEYLSKLRAKAFLASEINSQKGRQAATKAVVELYAHSLTEENRPLAEDLLELIKII